MKRPNRAVVKHHKILTRSPIAMLAMRRFLTDRIFGTLVIVKITRIFPGTPNRNMMLYMTTRNALNRSLSKGKWNTGGMGGMGGHKVLFVVVWLPWLRALVLVHKMVVWFVALAEVVLKTSKAIVFS